MPNNETLDFSAMYAAFKDVALHIGLTLDEIRIVSRKAHLVRSPFSIDLPEPAEIEVDLSAGAVADFLEKKAPGGLSDFAVKMEGGKIHIKAAMRLIVALPVSAVCTLRIDGGKRLFVDLESVEVMGAGPKGLVQKHLDEINPIFDLSELPVDGTLDSVEIGDGKALLKGSLSPRKD